MKNPLIIAVFGLLLAATPAFAQKHGGSRGNNGGHENHGNGGNRPAQAQQPHQQPRGNPGREQSRPDYRPQARPEYRPAPNREYDRRSAPELRSHWDGRRFDRPYFAAHWGYGHPFNWRSSNWIGPRWYVGSRFWVGGVWFSVIDPIPAYWYDDQIVVIYDDNDGCYYAIDQFHPGIRIHVGVAF